MLRNQNLKTLVNKKASKLPLLFVGYDRGEPTVSVLSTDWFPLMAGPNFQPSDGNPTVISILRQLADGPENVPEIQPIHLVGYRVWAERSTQRSADTRDMGTNTLRVVSMRMSTSNLVWCGLL